MSEKSIKRVRRQVKREMDANLKKQFRLFLQQAFSMRFFDRCIVAYCILRGEGGKKFQA